MVPWGDVCLPHDEGGINVKRPSAFNKALLCKLAFKVNANDSFVHKFLHSRFLKFGSLVKRSSIQSSILSFIKESSITVHETYQWVSGGNSDLPFFVF